MDCLSCCFTMPASLLPKRWAIGQLKNWSNTSPLAGCSIVMTRKSVIPVLNECR